MESGSKERENDWIKRLSEAEKEKIDDIINASEEKELDLSEMSIYEIADAQRMIDNVIALQIEKLQTTSDVAMKGLFEGRIKDLQRKRNGLEQEIVLRHLKSKRS